MLGTQRHHGFGELTALRLRPQQCARADLDVEHQRTRPLGDLLAHHRARDQRQRFDGGGDIAQRVELRIGGRQLARREYSRANLAKLLTHLIVRQISGEASDRFELVQGATGVAETATGCLRHRPTASGDDRHQRQRDLVAHPAGGVFVDGPQRIAVTPQTGEIHPLTRGHHGRRPSRGLAVVHAAQEHRHQQR